MALGCYVANYLPAAFKGVPMDAVEVTSEHGRRGAVGEFPFGEETAYADLGRKNRTYTLKVRFVENSHIADAEALIAAVESPGSGPLVHPTRGLVNAACRSLKIRDDLYEEQGVSYADLEFVEANDWPESLQFADSLFGVVPDLLLAAAEAVFLVDFVLDLVPFHRVLDVVSTVASVISAVRGEYALANVGTSDARTLRTLTDFDTILSDETLMRDPAIVKTAVSGGMTALARQLGGATKFAAMRRLANVSAGASLLPGQAGVAQDAVFTLARVVAGVYLAQATMEQRYTNSNEAFGNLDIAQAVLGGEEDIAYARCNNELFLELRRYTIAVQSQINSKVYVLPGIVTYDFAGSVHPLVAAYHIFGDAKQHRTLEASNVLSTSGRFGAPVVGVAA